jgi:hypothetical protein
MSFVSTPKILWSYGQFRAFVVHLDDPVLWLVLSRADSYICDLGERIFGTFGVTYDVNMMSTQLFTESVTPPRSINVNLVR